MIVDSKMECAQTYPEANIIPGRNAIPDDKGRALMANRFFQEMINVKTGPHVGKIIVVVPPASLEAVAAKAAASAPKGKGAKAASEADAAADAATSTPPTEESAVSNLELGPAIKIIRTLTVVDQLQQIAGNDPRQEVKEAAEAQIDKLAAQALKEAAGGKKDDAGQ